MEARGMVKPVDVSPPGDELRLRLRGMWAGVAGGWERHAAYVDARGAVVAEQMLERVAPRPGDRVLELACGPGGVGLAAAERVGPAGEVVLSDVVPEMTAIAAARAAALGLRNVATLELDAEWIDQPDASFDIVLCREGLMLVPDPASAAREIRRVLRPGGRVAIAVWGPRARNPWLGAIFDVVSAHFGTPMPPPGMPHPFSIDDAGRLARLLTDAGLKDVEVGELPTPCEVATADEWWENSCALAGPLAQKLASLPADVRRGLGTRAKAAIRGFETPAGLKIPGVTLLASAHHLTTQFDTI